MSVKHHFFRRVQRYILAGILTVIPIWVTWVVFEFILKQLSGIGMPWSEAITDYLQLHYPEAAKWLAASWFLNTISVIITIIALYLLGWIATQVIGRRIIDLFEMMIERIPIVQTVYGAIKKFITVLQTKPEGSQRVVLIAFPSEQMKTVGFVTRTMTDEKTGKQLAAVYVPTTPNPTSGYLEIVPVENLVPTEWSIDEAMTFIISGGAVAPDKITYEKSDSA